MRFRSAILALVLLAAPWSVRAQPIQGVYVGAGAGVGIPFAIRNSTQAPGFSGTFDLNQKPGVESWLSLGYAFGNGWRGEVEGTFGQSGVKGITGPSYLVAGAGTVRELGVMANALFDMDIGSPYVFPYLGFGVGYQSTGLQGFSVTRTAPSGTFSTSARAGGFAAQVIAGLAFPVPNRPGWSITADYRVMDILGGDTFNGASSFGPASGSTKMHNQFDQSAILGVRYAFDTPMPAALVPPAAETPPAQTRSFLVLFGPGSATLDSRASDVVAAAVRDAAQGQKTRVGVAGNADTSGNAAANMALSERRARVVAAAMIRAGVPKDEIAIQAFGDTKPAVPTGPGIARAENRRVEIVVQ